MLVESEQHADRNREPSLIRAAALRSATRRLFTYTRDGTRLRKRSCRSAVLLVPIAVFVLSGCQIVTSFGGPGTGSANAIAQVPTGVSIDQHGNVHIVDGYNAVVRDITTSTGSETTIAGSGTTGYAGDGAAAVRAELNHPSAMVSAYFGDAIADSGNNRIRIVCTNTTNAFGLSMTVGNIYSLAGDGIPAYHGDGGASTSAEVQGPEGLAIGLNNNIIVSDTENNVVRVIAKANGSYYGIAMTQGDIYKLAGTGTAGYSGDGGLATSAQLNNPIGVVTDGSGNILFADAGNGVVRVIAESSGPFYGIAMTAGSIYTVAGNGTAGYSGNGGPATSSQMNEPTGVAIDGSGNIIVSDTHNNVVRLVAESTGTFYGIAMTAGDIYTNAGNGTQGYSGDGGAGSSAEIQCAQWCSH